jgi:putative flippase GtrA
VHHARMSAMSSFLQHPLVHAVRAELPRLIRFGLIGTFSMLCVIALYALVSDVLWSSGPRTPQYVLVVSIVAFINYEANRHFTFGKQNRSSGSLARFATVAVIATGLNSTLFWFGHDVLRLWDYGVIVGATALVAFFTFSSHRLWTFHERPWRFFERSPRV